MDAGTGRIRRFENTEDIKAWEKELGHKAVPLTEHDAKEMEPLSVKQRKGWMRNQPCPCGSKRKFKKCCWHEYT